MPIIGQCTADRTSATHLRAMSLIAPPDSPPSVLFRSAFPDASEKAKGPTVLTAVIPSAPASTALLAIMPASPTDGTIFANIGNPVAPLTALTMDFTRSGFVPMVAPYPEA